MEKRIFLTAEWRKLAIFNFTVEPKLLQKYIPDGTNLDIWNSKCYVSLVGFRFLNTRVSRIRFPFHTNFNEVNLRFYVLYEKNGEIKRGVVFIKEIVPLPGLTFIANTLYGENYETLPMRHECEINKDHLRVKYSWRKGNWNTLEVNVENKPQVLRKGSEEEFITEHYWGYTKISETKTSEFEVAHDRWKIYPVNDYSLNVDFGKIYGEQWKILDDQQPSSVILAEGSEIAVKMKGII